MGFRAAKNPRAGWQADRPGWIREATGAARRRGIQFERRQQRALEERFGVARVSCNPWFEFEDDEGRFFCSPDVIIWFDEPVVVEVKTVHCERAWKQLNKLYIPVLKAVYPGRGFRAVEICGEFRPEVYWPELTLIGDIERAPRGGTGVHVSGR